MRRLPLYTSLPLTALEREAPRPAVNTCARCALGEPATVEEQARAAPRRCLTSPAGHVGGLLLVAPPPSRDEARGGVPLASSAGNFIRRAAATYWKGPVAGVHALGCHAPGGSSEKHVDACRGYMASTLVRVRPQRVLLFGWEAAYAFGWDVVPGDVRGGYGYLMGEDTPVPCFFLEDPAQATRNRFKHERLMRDVQRAIEWVAPPMPPINAVTRVVETAADAEEAVAALLARETAAFDVESAGILHDVSFRMLCLSLCPLGVDEPWTWPAAALGAPEVVGPLLRYLSSKHRKLGQNVKFDEVATELALGVRVGGVRGDVRLWRKLLDPLAGASLPALVTRVGMSGMKEEADLEMRRWVDRVRFGLTTERRMAKNAEADAAAAARGEKVRARPKLSEKAADGLAALADIDTRLPTLAPVVRNPDADAGQWKYGVIPEDMLLRYNARDSVGTARVAVVTEPEFASDAGLDTVRRDVVEPAARAVRALERWGVAADDEAARAFASYLEFRLDAPRTVIASYAGPDFNPNSPPQVAKLLFEKLKLPIIKRTDSGQPSTDDETLEALRGRHPIADALADTRSLAKLRGTYAVGMRRHIRRDGRIHPSVLLDGARSGRAACREPNLQNIPRADSPEGKMARDIFTATLDEDRVLLEMDYAQVELRIAAMLSQDALMLELFEQDVDIHMRTAQTISKVAWNIRPEEVTGAHRSKAKNVVFGIIYGKTARTFAREWGVTVDAAQRIVDAVAGQFKGLWAWIAKQRIEGKRSGFTWSWWNGQRARIRPMPELADPIEGVRVTAENGLVNNPIQSTASEFLTASLGAAVEWIEEERIESLVKLVLPVHDAFLLDVKRSALPMVHREMRGIMLGWNSGGVRMNVDAKVGERWGSLEKWKEAA